MRNIIVLFLLLFFFGFTNCQNKSLEKQAKQLIHKYDKSHAEKFLVDSLFFKDELWKVFNRYSLPFLGLEELNSEEDAKKLDIFIVPVLDIKAKALEYNYTQNFLDYLCEPEPLWYNDYFCYIFYNDILIGRLSANKKFGETEWRKSSTQTFREEQSFLAETIKKHQQSFFYCRTLRAYCYIENNQLYVCEYGKKMNNTIENYIKGYFSLKELQFNINRREKALQKYK